ncbi:MAG: DNA polymerase domain-containing protein, partial [Eubacteriales bacterium]|nr:DNA polymerase domain-containing protein [Eubacteriales bacterium]
MSAVGVEGKKVDISHPDKLLWPDIGVRKIDYIKALVALAPYLLPHTTGRALTALRYPDGIEEPFFYQKRPPKGIPEWVDILTEGGEPFVNLNSMATLVWLGNLAALEFHTPFCGADGMLRALVFDLDPSEGQTFGDAAACALRVNETLKELGIECFAKTSGASGIQVYIPARIMTFEQGRIINAFFGRYFAEKFPGMMTIERQVKKRGMKLYFDFLQMAPGKSIVSVYSPRAVKCGAVSMPVTWDELKNGVSPCDFHLLNAAQRLEHMGDLFAPML